MSYEVIKSVRQLMASGKGDTARLSYILSCLENGRNLYLSDKRYLEGLLNRYEDVIKNPSISESNTVSNLEKDLRDINEHLEKILQYRARDEKRITDHISTPKTDSTSRSSMIEGEKVQPKIVGGRIVQPKNEDTTLILSVVLGLVSLQGVGHIYIGKVAKGIGILISSLVTSVVSISYFLGFMKNSIPPMLNDYLPLILFAIYFGPYVFQVFDSRKMCSRYNAYVMEYNNVPPWW